MDFISNLPNLFGNKSFEEEEKEKKETSECSFLTTIKTRTKQGKRDQYRQIC
jgi:hypothetical protein